MLKKLITIFSLTLLLALPLHAQTPDDKAKEAKAKEESKQAQEQYSSLVEKVKKGDLTIDFTALRTSFTKTEGFSGYDKLDRAAAFGALNSKDFQTALKLAEDRLKKDYLDLNAHYVAFAANKELGKSDKAEFHRNVLTKLVEAIQKNGDGKTPETAFVVIGTDEEYFMISYLGYRPSSQGLMNANGHAYDRMTVIDTKTNETVTLYFQIDSFFGKF